MSVLLFLLSNYKAWKFPLRKTASCLLTWELSALCQTQTALHGGCISLGSAVIFASNQTVKCGLFRENEIGLSSLLLTAVIWEGLNLKVSASVSASVTLGVADYDLYQ